MRKMDASTADSPGWMDIVSNFAKLWLQIYGKKTKTQALCGVICSIMLDVG